MNKNNTMKKIKSFLKKNISIVLHTISPKLNIRFIFNIHYNYYKKFMSFKNPITMDEKIQWMKIYLYKDNPLVSQCADKYGVREYIKKKGCEEILNELYGAYDSVDEVPWDDLPNRFVLKWNFGCGHNFICKDKSKIDIEDTKKLLSKWRKTYKHFYKDDSEMQYKNIIPKLICEKFIETNDNSLPVDYKVYCFNGKPHCLLTCADRETGDTKFYFVDKNWKLLRYNKAGKSAPEGFLPPKPQGYEKLFDYAEKLSQPFPFVRTDFYLENEKLLFGELTFTPSGGKDTNRLIETNKLFGSMIDLNYNGN